MTLREQLTEKKDALVALKERIEAEDTEAIEEVRSVKQMRLIVQINHVTRIYTIPHHLVRRHAKFLVVFMCACEVIVIVYRCAVVAPTSPLNMNRAVHL